MQLDCLQNIADLWTKGVSNSMNELEKYVKSETADSNPNQNFETDNERVYNSKKYAKSLFKDGVFPSYKESNGSDANTESTLWASAEDVNQVDWRLQSYKGSWYIIEKFDDTSFGYQVTGKVPKKKYSYYASEWEKQYGQRFEKSMEDSENSIDNIYRRTNWDRERATNLDDDVTQYSRKNLSVQRMGKSENREQQNQLNTEQSSFSGDENRQRNETSGLEEKSESEKFSVKTVPNNRQLLSQTLVLNCETNALNKQQFMRISKQ